jgi:homoserine O-succinyltransferase/O-acetyltransferase
MPLVAHSNLPAFARLAEEGEEILSPDRASHQDVRELHIGLLNMMPDAAIQATERQYMRLISSSNRIVQFHIHPFTFPEIPRTDAAQEHIDKFYESPQSLQEEGLDALIISGATPIEPDIRDEIFWKPLVEMLDWANSNVTSVLCACLATHAVVRYFHGLERKPLKEKCWGVFPHRVSEAHHPLVRNTNTKFDVPHSRWNEIAADELVNAGLHLLVNSAESGVHMATSPDGLSFVYFQGHPEYDKVSLLKEYKREVNRFLYGDREEFPPPPAHYFSPEAREITDQIEARFTKKRHPNMLTEFPESELLARVDNTWLDTGKSVFNNWLGLVYKYTHMDRRIPYMDGVDPQDPLQLRRPGI